VLQLDRLFRLRVSFSAYSFVDYFKGFEKVEVVRRIFGEKTEEVLCNLRVEFSPFIGYMGVNDVNGHLVVNPTYLENGNRIDIYLDVIHELVHVRQHMEGRTLFDTNYSYTYRPTEVEAYWYAVEEGRRLGLSDERICDYLKVSWISNEDFEKLAKTLNLECK
jgi:hypothetical protein